MALGVFYLAVFLAGFTSLVYQVLWERSLELILGSSAYAAAAIVTTFMTGLALGGLASSAVADRLKRPLLWLGVLEIAIALYAWALPRIWPQNGWCIPLLLLPTLCMGGAWPLLCMVKPHPSSSPGQKTAVLYGINTLGASFGCFMAGFYFISGFGMSRTNALAAALNMVVGAAMLALSGRLPTEARGAPDPYAQEMTYPDWILTLVAVFTALSGLAALGYEILWFRALRFAIGSTVYSFSTMLTSLLAGLGLGGLLIGFGLRRRRSSALTFLGLSQFGLGLSSLWSIWIFSKAWRWLASLLEILGRYIPISAQSWSTTRFANFAVALVFLLIPALCLGCLFPLSNEILVRQGRPGRGAGLVYFINTMGCALGPGLFTFLMIPAVGINVSLLALAGLNLLMGAALLAVAHARGGGRVGLPYLAAAGAAAVLLSVCLLPRGFLRKSAGPSLLYDRDGVMATIRVFRQNGIKFLATDNIYVQGSDPLDPAVHPKRLGYLPYLIHPRERLGRALQIGLGTGINLSAVAECPVDSIDVVEIVPELAQAAGYFEEQNDAVLRNPKVRLIAQDGRRFVQSAAEKYDLIVGDLFFPEQAGAGNLYSLEHFTNCRRALSDQGMMVQWIPLHQVSADGLRVIMATFARVFPHVSLWWGTLSDELPVVALAGSRTDFMPEEGLVRLKMKRLSPGVGKVLWNDPDCFLGNFIMADDRLRAFVSGAPANTDDRPSIEFDAPREKTLAWDRRAIGEKLSLLADAMDTPDSHLAVALSRKAHQSVLKGLALGIAGREEDASILIRSGRGMAPGCEELKSVEAGLLQEKAER